MLILDTLNQNAGRIGLLLTLVILPALQRAAQHYSDQIALQRIIRGLEAGAEMAADRLLSGAKPDPALARAAAIEYAQAAYSDAFRRIAPRPRPSTTWRASR